MVRNCSVHLGVLLLCTLGAPCVSQAKDPAHGEWAEVQQYCTQCHNVEDWAGGVAFDVMTPQQVPSNAKVWEDAIVKLRGGFMPPPSAKRHLDPVAIKGLVTWLQDTLDSAEVDPHAGRVPLQRLNRREYGDAVRDLLGLDVDVSALLPADEVRDGFDNNALTLEVSPSFVDQYVSAARKVAELAVGNPKAPAVTTTYGNVADMVISLPPRGMPGEGTQEGYEDGMPFGTRGGIAFKHIFPADGQYVLTIGDMALGRDVPRMEYRNTVVALLDGKEFYRTDIGGDADDKAIDQKQQVAVDAINDRLRNIHFHATAGQHTIAVTFVERSLAVSDSRTRSLAPEGGEGHMQAVHALQIRGPITVTGMSESTSRTKIFICHPVKPQDEEPCAREIISTLARRAFRRPVTDQDLHPLMAFYEAGHQQSGFEGGVRDALSAILASPYFLYRAESSDEVRPGGTLSDLALASRLSFFIWGSLPDDELLDLAQRSELSKPDVLAREVRRMLADPRAESLVTGFAFQWLNIAALDEIVPDRRLFPDASGVLDPRPMYRKELALFIDSVLRSDQPVTALLTANYTYLNEPLAMLYGIGNVKGGEFRRVVLQDSKRDGLLGKGAILMLASNPDRTSPVRRGAWILEKIIGSPPPTPPPNVGKLPDAVRGRPATMRQRMAIHSVNPSCHSCHGVIDPLGLALENFNAIGQYEARDPITHLVLDTSGKLPDGTKISGPDDLRNALAARPDQFVQTLTTELMAYALGRSLDYRDMPTVRRIVRAAAHDDYRFADIVLQIVSSDEFRKRDGVSPVPAPALKTASLVETSRQNGGS
jgi:Protein of unknown function (DUF1592)/Protein of unknown function (DUF1588)/Protein of unknown function (DUF1585)/Protein of unknown function (DUF1595)/Protein of unknown function (DUF1587)